MLDVCCGSGTQSLLFAFLGASVVGVDNSHEQLELFGKRIRYYETHSGKTLNIRLIKADVTIHDFQQLAKFDTIYSYIGIGQLQCAETVFEKFCGLLNSGGLLILKNGNPECKWLSFFGKPPPDSTRNEYRTVAAKYGFDVIRAEGTAGLPRQFWGITPFSLRLSRALSRFLAFQLSISYTFQKADTKRIHSIAPARGYRLRIWLIARD